MLLVFSSVFSLPNNFVTADAGYDENGLMAWGGGGGLGVAIGWLIGTTVV